MTPLILGGKTGSSAVEKRHPQVRIIAEQGTTALRTRTYAVLLSLQKLAVEDLASDTKIQAHLQKAIAGAGIKGHQNSWRETYLRILRKAAEHGIDTLTGHAVRKDIASAMTFDAVNPRVLQAVDQTTMHLVTSITSETRAMLRAIALRATAQGMSAVDQARQMRPLLGLTRAQERALANYRAHLESGDYQAAMQNQLRDRRYDAAAIRALKEKQRLAGSQIDRMVSRYAERLLKYRADVIARTEALRAANAGQVETWRQAHEQGLTPDTVRMQWLVATDERTCPNCPRIPSMNPEGVVIGGLFNTPYGSIAAPPAHPLCRCALVLKW